ncbi:reverse transcriptase domain-containing protein [Tanacetum coccineum]|uniref:Reverse transcriptase domain-containing protein n=1 Tax=Tanacetum coccineum TaxID=301880 RepID=A0ABQ5IIE5_9ASTR
MRTRSQTRNRNRQQQAQPAVVQPFHLEEPVVNPPLPRPIKPYAFPFSLEVSPDWLEKEPLDLDMGFQQRFDESFYEAWDRFNDLLRACPHHGFSELHQLDTFYNALNANDQDSLNSAAGGNFLDKICSRECLEFIEINQGSRNSRNKVVVAKVSLNSSTPGISPDVVALTTEVSELKNMMKTMLIDKQKAQAPASVKAVEQTKIPLNENCSAMLLKKLPEKLGDPGKFLIPCNFPGMDVCHALADLGASINLMPLSIWKKLSLPELTPTRMTLELADRSITYPKGLAKYVFVKVRKFHFPTDFVVVDFEADPRVPLILGRSFLRTGRALIDVYGEEITLRVDNEAVTFNLDQTTRYSSTNDKSVNRIDIIDAVCEEYALELLGFSNFSGGNPTPTSEPFTFEFILEEIEAYLKDDSISPEIDHADCDPEGDIFLIEKLLNNDPF